MFIDVLSGFDLRSLNFYKFGAFNLSSFTQYLFQLDRRPRLTIEEVDTIENAIRKLPDLCYYTLQLSWRCGDSTRFDAVPYEAMKRMRTFERSACARLRNELKRIERELNERDKDEWEWPSNSENAYRSSVPTGDDRATERSLRRGNS